MTRRSVLRTVLASGVVTVLAAIGTVAAVTDASAATVQAGTPYVLVNRNSGKAVEIWERSTAYGARVVAVPGPDRLGGSTLTAPSGE